MKKITMLVTLLVTSYVFGQVGVNTPNPKSTLEIVKKTANTTNNVEGILIPRVSKNKAFLMGGNTSIEESTLVFVSDTADYTTTPVAASVEDITKNGYYFWNGTKWVSLPEKDDTGWLEKITENAKTGYRIRGVEPNNYGDTGVNAVDLGDSNAASTTVGALGDNSNVSGGLNNSVLSKTSVIGGGIGNQIRSSGTRPGTNGLQSLEISNLTIGGGSGNNMTYSSGSTIGGGISNQINATRDETLTYTQPDGGIIVLGTRPRYVSSTIAGGQGNKIYSPLSTIGGGFTNMITAATTGSTIAGGANNTASGDYAVVSGGNNNTAQSKGVVSGGTNNIADQNAVVAGGNNNNTTGGFFAVISGGNTNTASGSTSVVSGGYNNTASGAVSIVSGGYSNIASGHYSSILGGRYLKAESQNTIAMGVYNTADTSPEATAFTTLTKRLLVLGNGTADNARSDAFTILRNGKVGIDIDKFEDTTSDAKLQVNGLIESRTINTNAGSSTDKVVVADANGVFKTIDQSGFNEVVGNEVVDATQNRGLVRSGSGTVASPYTLGLPPSNNGLSAMRGTSNGNWTQGVFPYFSILDAYQAGIIPSLNNFTCANIGNIKAMYANNGRYHCSQPDSNNVRHWVYQGGFYKNGNWINGRVILPNTSTLSFEYYHASPPLPSTPATDYEVTEYSSTSGNFFSFSIGSDTYLVPNKVHSASLK